VPSCSWKWSRISHICLNCDLYSWTKHDVSIFQALVRLLDPDDEGTTKFKNGGNYLLMWYNIPENLDLKDNIVMVASLSLFVRFQLSSWGQILTDIFSMFFLECGECTQSEKVAAVGLFLHRVPNWNLGLHPRCHHRFNGLLQSVAGRPQ
jgi:hypothetical protein